MLPVEFEGAEKVPLYSSVYLFSSDPTAIFGPSSFENQNKPRVLAHVGTLPGAISGVVTVLGDPAVQKVRVYRRSDGALVGETTSAADGTYQINGLDPAEQHYVVALHGTLEYNAVVADNITPEEPA